MNSDMWHRAKQHSPDLVGVALADGLGGEEKSALDNTKHKAGQWTW